MTNNNDEIKKLKIKIADLNCSLEDYMEAFKLQAGNINSLILNLVKFNNNERKVYFTYKGNYYYPGDVFIDEDGDLIFELEEI